MRRKRDWLFIIVLSIWVLLVSGVGKKAMEAKGKDMKRIDVSGLAKTDRMMNEAVFWAIVEKSLKNTSSQEEQELFLIQELSELSPADMIGFRLRTDYLLYQSYSSNLWCAAYIMNGGASDDLFEYFRNWLISRGKDVYYSAMKNPDSLIHVVGDVSDMYEFETFWYVALEAFEKRTGKDLYDFIDYNKFKTTEMHYPNIELTWTEDKPETMKAICPKLFLKFWK